MFPRPLLSHYLALAARGNCAGFCLAGVAACVAGDVPAIDFARLVSYFPSGIQRWICKGKRYSFPLWLFNLFLISSKTLISFEMNSPVPSSLCSRSP